MAPTQDALYAGLDLDLSWSEQALPERERTKHVHRLHPYLGKFIPQLVEALARAVRPAGRHRARPVRRLGTTLVQSLESGRDAVGGDIAAFNCLLMRVKTAALQRVHAREGAPRRLRPSRTDTSGGQSLYHDCSGLRAELVRAAGCRRASLLALDRRRLRARGRAAGRPRPRRALGEAHDALRPRLPARAAAGAVLVPQAQARVPPRRPRRALPAPLRARHPEAHQGVRPRACTGARSDRPPRRRPRARVGRRASTPSSRRRPTRGSSTTTSSTATPTSCWASTTGASESSERPRRARAAPRSTRTWRASPTS